MTAKHNIFIDTNIWIYGLVESQQPDELHKHQQAISLLQTLIHTVNIHISL
ncbi:MAG: PIN domain-containing protein [bacterium]|nr:PIN domain-containing protein [bacterium]